MARYLELLFLHALPLDESMWAAQMSLFAGVAHAPTLYRFGDRLEDWASAALKQTSGERLIVIGCSIGGSCAIEIAAAAPERVAALVLIGTKARHRPDLAQHREAIEMLKDPEEAWRLLWAPLFGAKTDGMVVARAKQTMLKQPAGAVARGVTAFHTRPDRGRFLATFAGPVIIMTGEEDRVPGPKISAEQAEAARQGELHIVPECGHYLPLERPDYLSVVLKELIAELRAGRR